MAITLLGSGQTIVRVQSVMFTGVQTVTGNSPTWVNITDLSITITPQSSSSRFLLLAEINGAADDDGGKFRFSGGNSTTSVGGAAGSRQQVHNSWSLYSYNTITMMNGFGMYLDSPSTTSPITYTCQVGSDNDSTYINRTKSDSDGQFHARGVSTFTVMEISG
jgi:hypothetical protein